ncbi:ricin-like [Malania oleifera]|uniref:ricin-like n=1 Tax=Malania oleifera TaxID=397392 RepID=UPI0025ADE1CA|nr:ricin-like [Malania oleifera]
MVVYWTVVLATWLCSSTVAMADSGHDQPPTVPICSREGAHDRQLNAAFPDYPTVKFTTNGFVTKKYYRQFLKTIRGRVANESDARHGIPVLPNPSAVSDSQRFVLVELSNNAEDVVTLAIDVTNMYVVAYRAEDESYFFQEAPDVAFTELFTSTNQNTLTYCGNYKDLLRVAGLSDLDRVQVGMQELDTSISLLFHRSGAHIDQEKVARSLIICILMISEAVRFRHIEQRVADTIRSDSYGSFSPNGAVISFVRSWSQLSRGIQESNEDGSFGEIQLQRADYSGRLTVSDGMPDLVFTIGIM